MTVKQAQQSTRMWWMIGVGVIVAVGLLSVALRPWTRATPTTVSTQTGAPSTVDAAADAETQVSEGGQVTVKVARQEAQDGLSFSRPG